VVLWLRLRLRLRLRPHPGLVLGCGGSGVVQPEELEQEGAVAAGRLGQLEVEEVEGAVRGDGRREELRLQGAGGVRGGEGG
jgi:hypothetical protein